jgi:hypothetical protein
LDEPIDLITSFSSIGPKDQIKAATVMLAAFVDKDSFPDGMPEAAAVAHEARASGQSLAGSTDSELRSQLDLHIERVHAMAIEFIKKEEATIMKMLTEVYTGPENAQTFAPHVKASQAYITALKVLGELPLGKGQPNPAELESVVGLLSHLVAFAFS